MTKEVTKDVTDRMIKALLKNGVSYEIISRASGKSIDYIKNIDINI